MKKFLICLTCAAMLFSVTACKKDNGTVVDTQKQTDAKPETGIKNNGDEIYGQEDEFVTKEFTRENGTVYVKSTRHYNHLGYRITFATDLFDVETGDDYEKFTLKNSDGYIYMKAEAFGNLEETLSKIKDKYTIDTEATATFADVEWNVFLLGEKTQSTEIFVTEKNRIIYTLTVVQPTNDSNALYSQAIEDAIFSIEFQ